MSQISAVIPNYNGRYLLAQNLPAVLRCLRDQDQLIIVDDASTDDSVNWLLNQYRLSRDLNPAPAPSDYEVWRSSFRLNAQIKIEVILIKNRQNVRFGAAVNRGVSLATGELILLLNSDVRPHPDILPALLPHFAAEGTFAVGCLEKESVQNRIILGGKNTLTFQRGMFIHARATKFTSGKTAWVSGGSGMFDRQKWLELGGFDLLYYPAYWEDVDLSWQARQKGWKVLFEASAVVDHNHESTNKDAFGVKEMQKISWHNANKFVWKNGSFRQKILHLLWKPYWQWKLSHGHRGEEV